MPADSSPPDAIAELSDLWRALYGEPPPVRADVPMMVAALVESLPDPIGQAKE